MSKNIKYFPKATTAKTTYVELADEDFNWLKTELIRWLAVMTELDNSNNHLWKQVLKLYWNKKSVTLPKSKYGLNSPATFVAGLINNLVFGDQRDISQPQLNAIKTVSDNLTQVLDDVENIVFQIGVDYR